MPVYTGTLDRALWLVRQRLESNPSLKSGDVAILSRNLSKKQVEQIETKAGENGLTLQFHSLRADRAMQQLMGSPPTWKSGTALNNLYKHPRVHRLISRSLSKKEFSNLRMLHPLATAAEALDSTSKTFNFKEAWPALKITQDRDVAVTPAVASRPDAVQVMTIHAAKGLEFPVVLLMKLGKGSMRSFPNPKEPEESRLAYVGATRARDFLILVHTTKKPTKTLSAFGKNLVPVRRNRREIEHSPILSASILPTLPVIAATHLDYYEQCPLRFAAYHEGRFLPKWSRAQSNGARMHKSLEYYLRAEMPEDQHIIEQCFEKGLREGDSPLRVLPPAIVGKMRSGFREIARHLSETSTKVVSVEHRYRYLHGASGQVEGIVDALIERKDGALALKEWKTSVEILPDKQAQYELQARAGALGITAQSSKSIDVIEIVPLLHPKRTISFPYNSEFVDKSGQMLERVFKDLRDRSYIPKRGKHCTNCDLKLQCPAWH